MKLLVFVDPTPAEQDLAIELAVTAADHAMSTGNEVELLCDAATALEVAIAVLGRQPARGAEAPREALVPLTLLPLLARPDAREHAALQGLEVDDGSGDLDLLFDLGLFRDSATPGERPHRRAGDEPFRLARHLRESRPDAVLGLGSTSLLWKELDRRREDFPIRLFLFEGQFPRDLRPSPDDAFRRLPDVPRTSRDLEGRELSDPLALEEETAARRDGTLVADLLALLTDPDTRDRTRAL